MVNQKKRQTLKAAGAAIPAIAVPSWVIGGTLQHPNESGTAASLDVSQDDQNFSIELIFRPGYEADKVTSLNSTTGSSNEAWITITNHSNRVAIVKHVYPGLIHAGKVAYNINSIFENSACGIDAHRSRSFKVEPVSTTQAETDFPRHLFSKQPLRIAHTIGHDDRGLVVQSTRTVYC